MPHVSCAVVGCSNNLYQLRKWQNSWCDEHGCYKRDSVCVCQPPFSMIPFPTERHLEARTKWINIIDRIETEDREIKEKMGRGVFITTILRKGEKWVPSYFSRVCSIHFVDGKPTEANPYPTLHMENNDEGKLHGNAKLKKVYYSTILTNKNKKKGFRCKCSCCKRQANIVTSLKLKIARLERQVHGLKLGNSPQVTGSSCLKAGNKHEITNQNEASSVRKDAIDMQQKQIPRFRCCECNILFSSKLDMIRHLRKEHEYRGYTKLLSLAKNEGSPVKPTYKCSECAFTSHEVYMIARHIETIHLDTDQEQTVNETQTEKESPRANSATCDTTASQQSTENVQSKKCFPLKHTVHEEQAVCETQTEKESTRANSAPCDTSQQNTENVQSKKRDSSQQNTETIKFKCEKCNLFSSHKWLIERHIETAHAQQENTKTSKFKCSKCNLTSSHKWIIEKHIESAHEPQTVRCEVCNSYFGNKAEFDMHFNTVHCKSEISKELTVPQLIRPDQNVQTAAISLSVQQYLSNCVNIKPKPPTINQQQAQSIQSGAKKFKCESCSKSFQTKSQLMVHQRLNISKFKCNLCSKAFCINSLLKIHMRKHTGEKPFICDQCGKNFKKNDSLKSHIGIHHDGQKPFLCTVCGTKFGYKSGLHNHIVKCHSDERPFPCNYCDRTFKLNHELQIHERRHKKDLRYTCRECGKLFVSNSELKQHLVTHSGVRRYSCGLCESAYKWRGAISQHIKNRHPDVPVEERSSFVVERGNASDYAKGTSSEKPTEIQHVYDSEKLNHSITNHTYFSHLGNSDIYGIELY